MGTILISTKAGFEQVKQIEFNFDTQSWIVLDEEGQFVDESTDVCKLCKRHNDCCSYDSDRGRCHVLS